jgi:hypothetical protein
MKPPNTRSRQNKFNQKYIFFYIWIILANCDFYTTNDFECSCQKFERDQIRAGVIKPKKVSI